MGMGAEVRTRDGCLAGTPSTISLIKGVLLKQVGRVAKRGSASFTRTPAPRDAFGYGYRLPDRGPGSVPGDWFGKVLHQRQAGGAQHRSERYRGGAGVLAEGR